MQMFDRFVEVMSRIQHPLSAGSVRFETLDRRLLLSGSIDSSFGVGGLVTSDFGANDSAYAVAVQSDGRIVAAGTVHTPAGGNDFGLVRYMPDGSLDTSFGSGGFVTIDFGLTSASNDHARALVIDSSGRIVVAGYAHRGANNDFAMARLNTDGSLDMSFGTGGKVVTHFMNHDQANAMALQSDGKIVLAGIINNDFGVARYNPDG
jgi:uncharacterized delta-60 repeat protein